MTGGATPGPGARDGGVPFDELEVGMAAERATTVTETHLVLFAGLTGDFNPLHVDAAAAARSRFGGRVAHGILTAGFVSALLGTELPGPGCVYLGQSLRFPAPVRPGDTVTARVEVTEIVPERRRVRLRTTCVREDGDEVLEGEAEVWMPERDSNTEDPP